MKTVEQFETFDPVVDACANLLVNHVAMSLDGLYDESPGPMDFKLRDDTNLADNRIMEGRYNWVITVTPEEEWRKKHAKYPDQSIPHGFSFDIVKDKFKGDPEDVTALIFHLLTEWLADRHEPDFSDEAEKEYLEIVDPGGSNYESTNPSPLCGAEEDDSDLYNPTYIRREMSKDPTFWLAMVAAFLLAAALIAYTSVIIGNGSEPGYSYNVEGQTYSLHLTPVDEKSAALIKEYKLHTLDSSIGYIVYSEHKDAHGAELHPIMYDGHILVRKGFSPITDQEFAKLVGQVEDTYGDLGVIEDEDGNQSRVTWEDARHIMSLRNLAHPILRDGEYVQGEFMIHNAILDYWTIRSRGE